MAMTGDQALKRGQQVLETSEMMRACHEALCGLWLCYAYGSQWAEAGRGRHGGQAMRHMRTVISANRADVRLSMNLIKPRITKQNSRLKPKRLRFRTKSDSGASNDLMAAMVSEKLLETEAQRMGMLRALRKVSLWRVVLGSGLIRRTLRAVGMPVTIRDPAGQPIMGKNKQPKTIRSWEHGLSVDAPYEYIRDPSASDIEFDGEDCIGHEKPMPLSEVKRNFGHIPEIESMKTNSTMGQLLEFQRFLYGAVRQTMDKGFSQSKTPALMFGQWWLRDDSHDAKRRWPWYLITVRNSGGESGEDRKLQPVMFGPNPFFRLPIHHYWFHNELLQPWGRGVPSACKFPQDAVNIAFINMLRMLVSHGNTKYVIEENSLVDETSDALTNRFDLPIVYRRGAKAPDRLTPSPIDSNAASIMNKAPQWLDWMLNMSPVQGGEAVKRGEASKAYEFRLQQADTPLTDISDEDELTDNELLTGLQHDLMRTETLPTLREKLSGEFNDNQLTDFLRQDPEASGLGASVTPDSVRPKTPQEEKDAAKEYIDSGLSDPVDARMTLLSRARIALSHREGAAFDKQLVEIQLMLSGEPVESYLAQDHATHQYALSLEMESARFEAYDDQQKAALQEHWQGHEEMKGMLLQLQAQTEAAGQQQQAPMDMEMGGLAEPAGPQVPPLSMGGMPTSEVAPVGAGLPGLAPEGAGLAAPVAGAGAGPPLF